MVGKKLIPNDKGIDRMINDFKSQLNKQNKPEVQQ